MNKVIRFFVILFCVPFVLAACQSTGPVKTFTVGDALAEYDFAESGAFEEGAYDGAALRVSDGVYRIALDRGDNELWWGQGGETLSDVVIDVEVEQTSERNENAFGVGCRMSGAVGQTVEIDPALAAIAAGAEATAEATAADPATAEAEATEQATEEATAEPTEEATEEALQEGNVSQVPGSVLDDVFANGDGYLFLIQGTGSFAIMRSRERSLTPLVNWTPSDKINMGPARNRLRAVCMGDYLAFYINDVFVADATDDTYTEGQVGLAASAATRLGVQVEFDNLVVSEAGTG